MTIYYFGMVRCYERYCRANGFYRYEHSVGHRMGIDIVLCDGPRSVQGRNFNADTDEVVQCIHCLETSSAAEVERWENSAAWLRMGATTGNTKGRHRIDERH